MKRALLANLLLVLLSGALLGQVSIGGGSVGGGKVPTPWAFNVDFEDGTDGNMQTDCASGCDAYNPGVTNHSCGVATSGTDLGGGRVVPTIGGLKVGHCYTGDAGGTLGHAWFIGRFCGGTPATTWFEDGPCHPARDGDIWVRAKYWMSQADIDAIVAEPDPSHLKFFRSRTECFNLPGNQNGYVYDVMGKTGSDNLTHESDSGAWTTDIGPSNKFIGGAVQTLRHRFRRVNGVGVSDMYWNGVLIDSHSSSAIGDNTLYQCIHPGIGTLQCTTEANCKPTDLYIDDVCVSNFDPGDNGPCVAP